MLSIRKIASAIIFTFYLKITSAMTVLQPDVVNQVVYYNLNPAYANSNFQEPQILVGNWRAGNQRVSYMSFFRFSGVSSLETGDWWWDFWYTSVELKITVIDRETNTPMRVRIYNVIDNTASENWNKDTLTFNNNQGLVSGINNFNNANVENTALDSWTLGNDGTENIIDNQDLRDAIRNSTNDTVAFAIKQRNRSNNDDPYAWLSAELIISPEPSTTMLLLLSLSFLNFHRKRS